jgi:hypothetical protein
MSTCHVSIFIRYLAHLIPGVKLNDCSSVTTNKKEKERDMLLDLAHPIPDVVKRLFVRYIIHQ